jgi:di/tricarboxylate transporter
MLGDSWVDDPAYGLLCPIALALAEGLGLPPVPFVVCTAMGAVASFLTPIGTTATC